MSDKKRFAVTQFNDGITVHFQADLPATNTEDENEDEDESDGERPRVPIDFSQFIASCDMFGEAALDLSSRIADIEDPHARMLIERDRLLGEFAVAVVYARKTAGLKARDIADRTGLTRQAIEKILRAAEQPSGPKGPRLNTVDRLVHALDHKMTLRMDNTGAADGTLRASLIFVIAGGRVPSLGSQIVGQMRRVAGLSQSELEARLAEMRNKKEKALAGYVSTIEREEKSKSIHLGTLFELASACGFSVSLTLDPIDPKE